MTSAFLRFASAFAALAIAVNPAVAQDAPSGLKVGDLAPDFSLPAATMSGVSQTSVKLSELRGQTVVIAFYPRARTRGCTVQMQTYRDQFATLFNGGQGVTVLAVSTDPVDTIAAWAKDERFPMTFLSDREATVGQLYDVKYPAMNLLRRVLFVVGPDGRIAHIMRPFAELSADAYVELGNAVKAARGQ
ncbi:MAG TPA: peroxiredoxin [Gemmatimonadaceae bacterium]|nr:peroxiredoxin [Gemmatimonadaceae bacterium]HRQ79149.1 peroxiredoxin [Gemmatimonadaceae bacterium]